MLLLKPADFLCTAQTDRHCFLLFLSCGDSKKHQIFLRQLSEKFSFFLCGLENIAEWMYSKAVTNNAGDHENG